MRKAKKFRAACPTARQLERIPLVKINMRILAALTAALGLAACANPTLSQLQPTVQFAAGPTKDPVSFEADKVGCMKDAATQLASAAPDALKTSLVQSLGNVANAAVTSAMNSATSGTMPQAGTVNAQGLAQGVEQGVEQSAQQQYNTLYARCMIARGDSPLGSAEVLASATPVVVTSAPIAVPSDSGTVHGLKWAQIRLESLGYSLGVPDGVMGPHTRNALKQFQKAHQLAASGQLNDATVTALEQ